MIFVALSGCKKTMDSAINLKSVDSEPTNRCATYVGDTLEIDLSAANYFLDGTKITNLALLDEVGDDLIMVYSSDNLEDVNCFSTKELFTAWAENQTFGSELIQRDNSIDFLRDFAINNGVIEHFESTGEIMKSYLEVSDSVSAFYNNTKTSVWTRLWDFTNYGGGVYTMPLTMYPTLGSFNNKAESLKAWLTLLNTLCDKTWYRGARFHFIGLTYIYVPNLGNLRNKAESSCIL